MKKLNKIFNIVFVYVVFITLMGIGWSYLTDYLTEINWFTEYVIFGITRDYGVPLSP
jgi:hypothetical protein